jgi:hypothetical protein
MGKLGTHATRDIHRGWQHTISTKCIYRHPQQQKQQLSGKRNRRATRGMPHFGMLGQAGMHGPALTVRTAHEAEGGAATPLAHRQCGVDAAPGRPSRRRRRSAGARPRRPAAAAARQPAPGLPARPLRPGAPRTPRPLPRPLPRPRPAARAGPPRRRRPARAPAARAAPPPRAGCARAGSGPCDSGPLVRVRV